MGHLMAMGPAVVLPALEYLFTGSSRSSTGGRHCSSWTRRGFFSATRSSRRGFRRGSRRCARRTSTSSSRRRKWPTRRASPSFSRRSSRPATPKIFLPDDEALTPAMAEAYQAVGLTTAEIGKSSPRPRRSATTTTARSKGRRLFELGLGPAALALVGASSEKDQAFLDELVATRDPRDYARALFERRGVPWTGAGDAAPNRARRTPTAWSTLRNVDTTRARPTRRRCPSVPAFSRSSSPRTFSKARRTCSTAAL